MSRSRRRCVVLVDNGARLLTSPSARIRRVGPQSWDEAFAYAEQKGVLIVAAAGNRGSGKLQVVLRRFPAY